MFSQLTHAAFGASTLGARVMAKAIAVPVDTALWAHETTNRKPPKWNSRNEVVLAAPFALLRDFSVGDDDVVPTLLLPPMAALGLAGCAAFSPDGGMAAVSDLTQQAIAKDVVAIWPRG